MNAKRSLKSKMSVTIALVVFITVALISISANVLIRQQFKNYIASQQIEETKELINNLGQQYDLEMRQWNTGFINSIGMYALYEGYIIKVYGTDGITVWDAELHDMSLCTQVMKDITDQMKSRYPKIKGKFTSQEYDLIKNNEHVGQVSISYYGPYFLTDNDFQFLRALNVVLIGTGIFSLLITVIIGWVFANGISRPITKTVMITKAIADGNYNIQLENDANIKELNELVKAVNHLTDFLKKQEDLRKRMFADVAHELRTPLGIVSTHLEAMIEGIWEPTKDRLQSCHEEINRITKLVKELEHLAKVEQDILWLKPEPLQLADLVQNVCDNFEAMIRTKNINLQMITLNEGQGDLPVIMADRDRITQVVVNLLSNAVKYTPQNGEIIIKMEASKKLVLLTIEDNGIGIGAADLPFIFERFYRVDRSRNRKTGGAGIGLAIVKSIVHAHNGTIRVESQLGRGTIFQIQLPGE